MQEKKDGAMLLIPSRARPHNLRRLIEACQNTGTSTPAWIRLDEDDVCVPQYRELPMLEGWRIVVGPRVPLSSVYNEAYKSLTGITHWAFIADDVVPETPRWDKKLIEIAGADGMAVPAGGESTGGCPHFVLGGDMVRSMGWLSLPGLDRIYIDTVWRDVATDLGVLRRVPEVVLEHRHFSNKKALIDATYLKHHKAQDKIIYDNWRQNGNFP